MEKFFYKKKLIGIRHNNFTSGVTALTGPTSSLQILALKHPKNKKTAPHFHRAIRRTTNHLQECVIVTKGKITIDLYGSDNKHFKKLHLKTGELFTLIDGGHALTVNEDAEIFEIKNGPFKNDRVNI